MEKLRSAQSIKRSHTKKSHSWWWDSHISRKNSKWLAENLAVMDRSVKEMLKLIEEEGDSFAKKAEMYYERRPQLISQVEEFYRMYRALAERYDQVTGELRKNIKSEFKHQNSGEGLDLVSEPPSPTPLHASEVTPMSKSRHAMLTTRAAGFSFFLGSGGSSDTSKKSSNDSSSSSSSDSESEGDDLSETNGDDDESVLHHKIVELENELDELKEKLKSHEANGHLENGNGSDHSAEISRLEEQLLESNHKIHESEEMILSLQKQLEESKASLEAKDVELFSEQKKVQELEERILLFQDEILVYKRENERWKSSLEAATEELRSYISQSDDKFEQYKNELKVAGEKYSKENAILRDRIAGFEDINSVLNAKVDKYDKGNVTLEGLIAELELVVRNLKDSSANTTDILLQEKSTLESIILVLSHSNASLEAKVSELVDQIRKTEAEKTAAAEEHLKHITELNKKLDALSLKADMVTAEKQELDAKLSSLLDDLKCRGEKILQLQSEQVKLATELEATSRLSSEFQLKVKGLEEEVEKQKVAVFDRDEGKREAIRQLCFSLEHYRDRYNHLRQMLQGQKRSAVMVS